jgi:glutathione S-transferase
MIEYLDEHYPGAHPLLPEEPDARLEARLWDRLFDLYVMLPMQKVVGDRLRADERDLRGVAEAISTPRTAYDMIESKLSDRTWAAGNEFTIADCSAAPSFFYASIVEPLPSHHVSV